MFFPQKTMGTIFKYVKTLPRSFNHIKIFFLQRITTGIIVAAAKEINREFKRQHFVICAKPYTLSPNRRCWYKLLSPPDVNSFDGVLALHHRLGKKDSRNKRIHSVYCACSKRVHDINPQKRPATILIDIVKGSNWILYKFTYHFAFSIWRYWPSIYSYIIISVFVWFVLKMNFSSFKVQKHFPPFVWVSYINFSISSINGVTSGERIIKGRSVWFFVPGW